MYEDTNHKLMETEPSSSTTSTIQSASESIPFGPAVDAVKLLNAENDRWGREYPAYRGHMFQDGEVQLKSELNLFEPQRHEDLLSYQQQQENFPLPAHSETSYVCPECPECFSQIEKLEAHVLTHIAEQSHECTICGKVFSQLSKLKSHMKLKSHKDKKPHKCAECGMSFYKKNYLINHLLTHDGDLITKMNVHSGKKNPHGCVLCYKRFAGEYYLKDHMKQHQCTVCGKMTLQMRMHMESHTNNQKRHKCAKCGKCFQLISKLNLHMKTHTRETLHICNLCGKNFRRAEYLKEHMIEHSGGTHYACETCGKKYASKDPLQRHMNDHLAIKPHICAVCGKGFGIRFSLTKHMKVHTGGKTHTCNVCGKTFFLAEYLIDHRFEHSGEERPKCEKCDKKFSNKYILASHMELHKLRTTLTDERELLKRRYENAKHRLMRAKLSSSISSTSATLPGTEPSPLVQDNAVKLLDAEHNNTDTTNSAVKGDQMSQDEKVILESEFNDHFTITPRVCAECGKRFDSQHSLTHHMKNYICNICGKYLCSVKILRQHLIEHSGENPLECKPIYANDFLRSLQKRQHDNPL